LIRILILTFVLFFHNISYAEIKKINITGNTRVSSSLIEALIDKKNINIDSIFINNLTKKIYDTDFFSDVKISYNQEILSINLTENPVINFFYISGAEDSELTKINPIISLKENNIFSSSKLKKDIESIKELYKQSGYHSANVNPEIIKIESNQVNLILNINKGDISKIKTIHFIGNKYFSSSQLLDVISSAEYGWWKFFSFTSLSEQKIEYDKLLLSDFYKSKGFYDAQVESAFAEKAKNSQDFILTFSINSGKKYKFNKFEIEDSNKIYKQDDIKEINLFSNNILKNQTYSPLLVSKINKQIDNFLEQKKYINYEINLKEIKQSNELIDVVLQLNEQKKVFINKINVEGNNVTEEKTIRDNLSLSEGDYFNSSKIKKSIDVLKSKQYFSKIDYKIQESDRKDFKNLNLTVKEQATGSISAGVGYGSDGAILEGSINERNFIGKGIDLNFTGKITSEKIGGVFSYTDPNFLSSEKEFAYSLYSETDDYKNSGYQNKRVGNKVATKYEIYEDVYFRPNIAIQYDDLQTSSAASSLIRSRDGSYLTTSVGYNISLDLRDSKYNPTSGSIFYIEQNLSTLASDIPSIQTGLGSTFYKELVNQDFIGSARFRLDSVVGLDNSKDVKLSDRLFSSYRDLKGFQTRGVGPIDNSDHVGGNYLATVSFKSTFPNPIPESLRATSLIFFDLGNVWGVDYSNSISDSNKIRSSTGIALDVLSPLGPISFSYAIPISKASTDKEQRFMFNIGSSF
jgi:outer membrane protein insertion porin family